MWIIRSADRRCKQMQSLRSQTDPPTGVTLLRPVWVGLPDETSWRSIVGHPCSRSLDCGRGPSTSATASSPGVSGLGNFLGRLSRCLQLRHSGRGPNLVVSQRHHVISAAGSKWATTFPLCVAALLCQPQSARICDGIRHRVASCPGADDRDACVDSTHSHRHSHASRNLRPPFPLAAVVLWALRYSLGKSLVCGR